MDNPNQPVENPTDNQNPPRNFGSQFLTIINAKWFLVGVVLLACAGLYAISASSRGLWPFPAPEEKVVLTPTPSSTFTSLPDPTASWKTYRNEQYGFEFKYPDDWTVEVASNINFTSPNINLISPSNQEAKNKNVERCQKNEPCDIEFPFININLAITAGLSKYKPENAISEQIQVFNGINFVRYAEPSMFIGISYQVEHNNTLFIFEPVMEDDEIILRKILSTFKFILSINSGPVPSTPSENGTACIQVITLARNPQTGEVKDFPTPCDVPMGWEVLQ